MSVTDKQVLCQHEDFTVRADVMRLTDEAGKVVIGFTMDITVRCTQCDLPFRFRGNQFGSSPDQPMLSANAQELRAPIEPAYTEEILGRPLQSGRG